MRPEEKKKKKNWTIPLQKHCSFSCKYLIILLKSNKNYDITLMHKLINELNAECIAYINVKCGVLYTRNWFKYVCTSREFTHSPPPHQNSNMMVWYYSRTYAQHIKTNMNSNSLTLYFDNIVYTWTFTWQKNPYSLK